MIELKQIYFSYSQLEQAINLPELNIQTGEKIAVVGASGAGKSTLLNLLAGFLYPQRGDIYLNNQRHTYSKPYQRPVSILFQDNNLFNHLKVAENIVLGLQPSLKIKAAQFVQLSNIAEKVGLKDYLDFYPEQLSGGQKQRVALARCMLRNQPILLLDEPFSALDKPLRMEMLALLEEICLAKQLTVIMVTHQPEELARFVDRSITIAS